jgi:hypothetical protein
MCHCQTTVESICAYIYFQEKSISWSCSFTDTKVNKKQLGLPDFNYYILVILVRKMNAYFRDISGKYLPNYGK